MKAKTFKAQPIGLIKSGTLTYQFNPATGNIVYAGSVKAGWGFLTKNISKKGEYKVDPSLMKSARFVEGAELKIEKLKIKVISVHGKNATATLSLEGDDATGTISLDLSGEYIEPMALDVSATVSNKAIRLILA